MVPIVKPKKKVATKPTHSSPAPTTALARRAPEQSLVVASNEEAHADSLANHAHADATRKAYELDLQDWRRYARSKGISEPFFPVSPKHLRNYIASMDLRGLSVSTIRRRCAAIARLHTNERVPSPTRHPDVSAVLRGLSRERTTAPQKKVALTPEVVMDALEHVDRPRDRALLLFGICSAMRRSEIVAIRWRDVTDNAEGVDVRIRSSKTDKHGRGATIGLLRIPDLPQMCPVRALHEWRKVQNPKPGDRVFPMCGHTVANIIKRSVELAGRDRSEYAGHSFRSGFSTNAANRGVPMELWMKHTRHRSPEVASGYAHVATALSNPGAVAMRDSLREAALRKSTKRTS